MPVQDPHPKYTKHEAQWVRCEDAFEGQDTIKGKTIDSEAYLRRLPGMDEDVSTETRSRGTAEKDSAWKRYVDRALWYNASKRTMRANTGFVFRKEAIVKLPPRMEEATQDVTLGGVSLGAFARRMIAMQVRKGRYGILTDYSEQHKRARLCGYPAESILNWDFRVVDGVRKLSELRLMEASSPMPDPDDPAWRTVRRRQIRVLQLQEEREGVPGVP